MSSHNMVNIGWGTGFSPDRRKAITCHLNPEQLNLKNIIFPVTKCIYDSIRKWMPFGSCLNGLILVALFEALIMTIWNGSFEIWGIIMMFVEIKLLRHR